MDGLDWIGAGVRAQEAVDAEITKAHKEIFKVGARVVKTKGYEFDSIVIGQAVNSAGELRLVCESTTIPLLLHIFAPSQLAPDRRRRSQG